jgi:peptidyl-prolyl cis-trans isomerase D
MALISKIRKNSWLLIVLIGLGLAGFIVMDMTSGQQSIFGSGQTIIGEINGEKLDWNQFNKTEDLLYSGSTAEVYNRRDNLWRYFIENIIITQEAEKLGIGVARDELRELEFGQNLSPVIVQRFSNPNMPGMVDRQQVEYFKQLIDGNRIGDAIQSGQLSPTFPSFWRYQEGEIIKERLESKLVSMVSKAMYTPTWMAEILDVEQNYQVDFSYVQVPFSAIDNSEVNLSDADYKAYIKEFEKTLKQDEETRTIEFVVFNVLPTATDSALLKDALNNLRSDFESAENTEAFVEINFGGFDKAYYTEDQLPAGMADIVKSLEKGQVSDVFQDNNTFKVVKLLDKKVIPDSVKSRHILLPVSSPEQYQASDLLLDSLIGLLESKSESFDSLAAKFGTDGTRTTGGDLGYASQGMMVKEYNDLIFFEAEPSKYYKVNTQFGIHLVEVTDRKFVERKDGFQIAFLNEDIVPSQETQNSIYDEVLQFTGKNRTLDALKQSLDGNLGLRLETVRGLKRNDFSVGGLGAGQTSRDMIRWAFGEKPGRVSPEIYIYQDQVNYYNNRYVVTGLKEIVNEGLPEVSAVKDRIVLEVTNRKKSDLIAQRVKGKSPEEVAAMFGLSVENANGIPLSTNFVPGIGNEPKVIARAFSMKTGEVSAPVTGLNGVYVVRLDNKPTPPISTNALVLKRTFTSQNASQVSFRLVESLRKNAQITDNRFRFY